MLKLLNTLQSDDGHSADKLSDELGVSVRTVFRDLNLLEMAGIPFFHDETRGGYRIAKSYFLKPVDLTVEEAMAILTLGENARLMPFQEAAYSGLLKIRNILPAGVRDELSDALPRIKVRPIAKGSCNADVYRLFRDAVQRSYTVKARYNSVHDKAEIDVEIRPYTLFFSKHSWYVVGYTSVHKEIRTFKLARFLSAVKTKKRFTMPKDFTLDKYLGNAWNMIRGDKDHKVKIHFTPKAVPYVKETLWHPTQKITDTADGGCDFEVTVSGLDEIRPWILSWGEMAEVMDAATAKHL